MTSRRLTFMCVTAALMVASNAAMAQTAVPPIPWMLTPDMGYGYASDGKTLTYKMGTNNAKFLLKGAKKVPPQYAVFRRRERPALYAHRAISGARRQVHVRAKLAPWRRRPGELSTTLHQNNKVSA